MGSVDHPPTAALINWHASGSALPPIPRLLHPAVVGSARDSSPCGVDRARVRVRPVIEDVAEFHRAGMLRRRVDELKHPGPGLAGGKAPRRAPRGRLHPHLPQPFAGAEPDQGFSAVRVDRPLDSAALRHKLLCWRVDELGMPAGGRPVYAMNSIERGPALHSFLGPYWSPSAPDPGGQRTNRRAGACSVTARERGPIVCTGFGGPADHSPPPPPPRPQERRLPS